MDAPGRNGLVRSMRSMLDALHGTNISHFRERKFIFKGALGGDMLVPNRLQL